jgi:hypothetical protein
MIKFMGWTLNITKEVAEKDPMTVDPVGIKLPAASESSSSGINEFEWLESKGSPETMRNALAFAKSHGNSPKIIRSTIRILARKRQSDLLACIIRNGGERVPTYDSSTYLFSEMPLDLDSCEIEAAPRILDLGKDMVLPWPWRWDRYSALSYIGNDVKNPWKEESNHSVVYFLPLEVGFVSGGNHSLASGIIQCEGTLTARDIYDLSPVYKDFHWDRRGNFVCGGKSYPIHDFDMAAILELGRLLCS